MGLPDLTERVNSDVTLFPDESFCQEYLPNFWSPNSEVNLQYSQITNIVWFPWPLISILSSLDYKCQQPLAWSAYSYW